MTFPLYTKKGVILYVSTADNQFSEPLDVCCILLSRSQNPNELHPVLIAIHVVAEHV